MLRRLRVWLVLVALGLCSCSGRVAEPPTAQPQDTTPDDPSLQGIGGPCAFHGQCGSGVCSVDDVVACGTCIEAPPLGTPCYQPSVACGARAACDVEDGVCESTRLPRGAKCKLGPLYEDIGRCGDHRWCLDDNGVNDGGPGTCMPRLALGESCTGGFGEAPCDSGAICADGVCIPYVVRKLGEPCEWASCDPGLYCGVPPGGPPSAQAICHEPGLPQGAACGLVNDELIPDDCLAGTTCGNLDFPDGGGGPETSSTCVPLPLAGAPCVHEQCASGLVCERIGDAYDMVPTCIVPHADGEACGWALYPPYTVCQAGLECRLSICYPACN